MVRTGSRNCMWAIVIWTGDLCTYLNQREYLPATDCNALSHGQYRFERPQSAVFPNLIFLGVGCHCGIQTLAQGGIGKIGQGFTSECSVVFWTVAVVEGGPLEHVDGINIGLLLATLIRTCT